MSGIGIRYGLLRPIAARITPNFVVSVRWSVVLRKKVVFENPSRLLFEEWPRLTMSGSQFSGSFQWLGLESLHLMLFISGLLDDDSVGTPPNFFGQLHECFGGKCGSLGPSAMLGRRFSSIGMFYLTWCDSGRPFLLCHVMDHSVGDHLFGRFHRIMQCDLALFVHLLLLHHVHWYCSVGMDWWSNWAYVL